ncbi:peptidoglycan editing factor PgeF [Aquibacillus kalidii]|uniref:peptidoglycan editing factor PgeF n=1 Tax=Aquibacillus kalidii TaxID=2762597 RepID=UPI001C995F70|nr:peptidoglycan editing factor PgeF [Aquibacillus kalidii]
MEPFESIEHESILLVRDWDQQNSKIKVTVGFTTRNGGVSNPPFDSFNLGFHVPDDPTLVLSNRKQLASLLSFPIERWVIGEQIHSTTIKIIEEADLGRGSVSHDNTIQGVDGLITNKPEVLCAALFADCVPLFFYDPNSMWIGIAHAGWRGSVGGIAEEMVANLVRSGANLNNIKVLIGPCIGEHVYEVDQKVIDNIEREFITKVVRQKENGNYLLDLKTLNQMYLKKVGVLPENISVSSYCTYTDDKFFSHRGDLGKTGRMLGFIGYTVKS